MSQTLRYINRLQKARSVNAFDNLLPTVKGEGDKEKIIRLDALSLFMISFAIFNSLAVIVSTNSAADVVAINYKYLVLGGAGVIFAPILIGGYFYNLKELGPISRPLYRGKREVFPDVALITGIAAFFAAGIADYGFTHGGFFPTLSFWSQLTPRLTFGSGGIYEEFIFRAVVFGAVNRFAPGSIQNRAFSLLVIAPLDAGLFTAYHLWAYVGSKLALDIVATEGYILAATYVLPKWALWVVMGVHFFINYTVAPS
jgi:hypothetical protein